MNPSSNAFDVIVFGSGAAGLTAALTASVHGMSVLLCEKEALIGGTSATSGGSCWVPGNHLASAAGSNDTPARAAAYLDRCIGEADVDGRRKAFLEAAPLAFRFIEQHSALTFSMPRFYPDYYPDDPDAAQWGRTIQAAPFDGRKLGEAFDLLRPPNPGMMVFGGLMTNRAEAPLLTRPFSSPHAFAFAVNSMLRFARDRLSWSRGTRLLLGNALVAALLFTLRERGVPIWTRASLQALCMEDGRVSGARLSRDGTTIELVAHRAVILATGGFTSDARSRAELGDGKGCEWALSAAGATGDGFRAANALGARLERHAIAPMFYMPVSVMPRGRRGAFAFPHVIQDRARPGLIAVRRDGRRFINEACSYHDFSLGMSASTPDTRDAFLICDRRFVRKYGLGVVRPVWQWLTWYRRCGYLKEGATIEALAHLLGIDATGLKQSIERHNHDALTGCDTQFDKGGDALQRMYGDASITPNPCLAPIADGPFVGVRVEPAAIGASNGIRTDADARVLDADGVPIAGLYACGNDQSSIMRGAYPGAGITLGPAMTFAYRAIEHTRLVSVRHSRETSSC